MHRQIVISKPAPVGTVTPLWKSIIQNSCQNGYNKGLDWNLTRRQIWNWVFTSKCIAREYFQNSADENAYNVVYINLETRMHQVCVDQDVGKLKGKLRFHNFLL